jgi:hypothetical protein
MAPIDAVTAMKSSALTQKQKNELKKKFHGHKRVLEAAMSVDDRGFEALAAEKPKPKRAALRRNLYKKTRQSSAEQDASLKSRGDKDPQG